MIAIPHLYPQPHLQLPAKPGAQESWRSRHARVAGDHSQRSNTPEPALLRGRSVCLPGSPNSETRTLLRDPLQGLSGFP
jgi:hypothetical protein